MRPPRTASTLPEGFADWAASIASKTDLSTPAFFKAMSACGEVSKSVLLDWISFTIRAASKPLGGHVDDVRVGERFLRLREGCRDCEDG